ncbi:MAG: DNA-directed RNA polymerase subunit delta [Bacilli bacterium]|jgi:DNA-directed RNA polymerase subunit delta|nr:DNA-directed RNA polymerase subunit delta [Bacilli bacterium]
MSKSLIEFAYEFVSSHEGSVNFTEIWNYVKEQSGLSEEDAAKKAGQFFTNMMLDGRFVTLGENEWDLRERHTFDKVHIDMKDVYSDVQTSDDDSEEEEEEDEYNRAFDESKEESSVEEDSDEEKEDSSNSEEEF